MSRRRNLSVSTEYEIFKNHTPAGSRTSSMKDVEIYIQDYLKINRVSKQDVENILLQDAQKC